LSRRVRKSDRIMLSQQPVIRNLTGIGVSFGSAPAGVRAGSIHARTMPVLLCPKESRVDGGRGHKLEGAKVQG
jgi:hypothetical protein